MEKKQIVVLFINHRNGTERDIEIPLDITAGELITGLNKGLLLGMNTDDLFECSLSAENPIILIKGNRTIGELGLHDGSIIHFV